MPYYQIENWDQNYETPESKGYKNLHWVAVKNSFDGTLYRRLLKQKDPIAVFGIAVIMAEIASRSPKGHRGKLIKSDLSTGYTLEDMADKSGMPLSGFIHAIPILMNIGWISYIDGQRKIKEISGKIPLHNMT
ncbi:MAG: hypothetical protein RDU76_06115 [Candidatus Edwardsbacteria bacterium]|nr:hypothetical protein [Candidatus Edwardsbacteria bacterium]